MASADSAISPSQRALTSQDEGSSLCSTCRAINLDYLLPFTNVTKEGAAQDPAPADAIFPLRRYRKTDGSLFWLREDQFHEVDLGSVEEVLLRERQCSLCRLVITILRRNPKVPSLLVPSLFGHPTHILLQRTLLGDVRNYVDHQLWNLSRFRIRVGKPPTNESPLDAFVEDPYQDSTTMQIGVPRGTDELDGSLAGSIFLGRIRDARCDLELCNLWLSTCLKHHKACSIDSLPTQSGSIRLINVQKNCLEDFMISGIQKVEYFALSYVWGLNAQRLTLTKDTLSRLYEENSLRDLPTTIRDAIDVVRRLKKQYLWVDALCIVQDDPHDQSTQIPLMTVIYQRAILTICAAYGRDASAGLPGVNNDRTGQLVTAAAPAGRFIALSTAHDVSRVERTVWNSRAWTFQEHILSRRRLFFFEDCMVWKCQCTDWMEDMELEGANHLFSWSGPETLPEVSLRNYRDLVADYSKRSLTHERDVENAFAGIIGALPERTFKGLPCVGFESYLAWEYPSYEKSADCRRREVEGIPSWSWHSWRGEIALPRNPHDSREIVCYRWDASNQRLKLIATPPLEGSQPVTDVESGAYECTTHDIPPAVELNGNHLIFWAYVARFRVEIEEGGWVYFFCPSSDTFIGSFRPLAVCSIKNDSVHDFILIGKREQRADLQVMLISWQGGIARREYSGEISGEQEPFADATRKLIILG